MRVAAPVATSTRYSSSRPSSRAISTTASASGEPVGDVMVAGHVDLEVAPLTGREVPDRRALTILGLVGDGEPLVAGNRRPGGGDDRRGAVAAFRGDGPAPRLHDPKRGVHQAAVLGVLDRHERAVRGQARKVAQVFITRNGHPVLRAGDPAQPLPVDRRVDAERAVLGADPRRDHTGTLRDPAVPPARRPVEEGLGPAALVRLHLPGAHLVAGVLLPEDHLGTVGRRIALAHADRVLGDLPPAPARDVPDVDLPDARGVRLVDASIGLGARPSRKGHHRRAETLFPQRHGVHRRGG